MFLSAHFYHSLRSPLDVSLAAVPCFYKHGAPCPIQIRRDIILEDIIQLVQITKVRNKDI